MTKRPPVLPPEPEEFAALVQARLSATERNWPWLARHTEIPVNTLRSQLVDKPTRLTLVTARRVATALDISMWGDAA